MSKKEKKEKKVKEKKEKKGKKEKKEKKDKKDKKSRSKSRERGQSESRSTEKTVSVVGDFNLVNRLMREFPEGAEFEQDGKRVQYRLIGAVGDTNDVSALDEFVLCVFDVREPETLNVLKTKVRSSVLLYESSQLIALLYDSC